MVVPQNFPNDREYTLDAMLEELALMERHLRDGSWTLCRCNPEKHLPLIAGLASEGFGFADDPDEKEWMRNVRNHARIIRGKISRGEFNTEDADKLRDWAREMRHRIEYRRWSGEMEDAPELENVVKEIHALSGGIPELEEKQVDRILRALSKKHGIPKPKHRFIDQCNPMKDAYAVGVDMIIDRKGPDGGLISTERVPLTDRDELVFCRGGASPYAVAHEFCHHLERVEKGSTTERGATDCALAEVGNSYLVEKSLNTLSVTENRGGIMAIRTQKIFAAAPLVAGVFVGEAIDEMGIIEQYIGPYVVGYEGIAKAGVGILSLGLGVGAWGKMNKGAMGDFLVGMGIPLVVSGLKQQFMGLTAPAARAKARAYATPRGLTPYSVPTGLRAGHPTLSVPRLPPRPGMLQPRPMTAYGGGLERALSGKWVLGGP